MECTVVVTAAHVRRRLIPVREVIDWAVDIITGETF